MATDQPKKPDDSAQAGASTAKPEGARPLGSEGRSQDRPSVKRGSTSAGAATDAGGGHSPASGPHGQGPRRTASTGQANSSAATAASAGGLSAGGSPTTGSSGRGAKSLGRPGGAGIPGAAGASGAPGSLGTPGSQRAGGAHGVAEAGSGGSRTIPAAPGSDSGFTTTSATTSASAGPDSRGTAAAAGAEKSSGGVQKAADTVGQGSDGLAANAAGEMARQKVGGDGSSKGREAAGRYTGAATSGAVEGASKGGLHGAAVGAAKNVAVEGGKDVLEGAKKATGGSPAVEPADKRLGAGGTSYERGGPDQDGESQGAKTAKKVAAAGTAAAAPPAMGLAMLLALMAWLKSMFFMMLALVANLGNLAWKLFVAAVKAVVSFVTKPFVALGGLIAKGAGALFGAAVAATIAPVATVGSAVVAMGMSVALIGSVFGGVLNQTALTDGRVDRGWANCVVNASNTTGGGAQVPADTEKNAQAVYSVLKTWGMPNENIAGILGNWSQESGIDPTSVEGIYDEPYQIGPRKKAAWDGNFTHIPGQSHGGIGLGQWSNGRTPMLLDYAKAKGKDWYTIQTQLAFMVEGDNPSDTAVFKDMIKNSQGSPSQAAYYFHDKWERSADTSEMKAKRAANAEMWMAKMSGWSVDSSLVGGIEDIVGGIIDVVGDGVRTVMGNCTQKNAGTVGLVDGGMTEEQAKAITDLYNQEGDRFLDEKYGPGGGPGSCGDNHAENCVSFSTYFMNKYTTFDQYAPGNGIRTAYSIAEMTGKQVQDTPVAYSIGSGPGSGPAGHTFAVLGVQGDKVIVGEAGYCAYMGRVSVRSAAELKAAGWKFVDVTDLIKKDGLPAAKA